jgi:hypothetical protein
MSFRDFLLLSVTATIIALAPALHSPVAESLSGVWASVSP